MKRVQLAVARELLRALDEAAKWLGKTLSGFLRMALRRALIRGREQGLEQQQRLGYERRPLKPEEFDVWETQQVWPH